MTMHTDQALAPLLIERALTEEQRDRLLDAAARANPNLRGAHVSDVLSIYEDNDAFLERREAFWAKYGAPTQERIKQVYDQPDSLLIGSVIAAELLGEAMESWPLDLAMTALRKARLLGSAGEQRECPEGHGPMIFYASEPDEIVEGQPSFYECPDCGHQEKMPL